MKAQFHPATKATVRSRNKTESASSVMRICALLVSLAVVLACGCATGNLTRANGDVGRFILQHAIDYGGNPSVTNGLPVVTTSWRYATDRNGMLIHLPASDYSGVEAYLNLAFAGAKQFGPKVSDDGTHRIHEYRMSPQGGGIQLAGDRNATSVTILKPMKKR